MNATILSNNEKHYPVLLNEILSIISPQNGGTFIDCTFGQGGYSKEILKFSNTKVIAFDRDSKCKEIADSLKKKNKDRFTFFNKKFSDIKDLESDFKHIRAHTGLEDEHSIGNEHADRLANLAIGVESCPYQRIKNKIYLNVPYDEKDEAKQMGAKWDKSKKRWYIEPKNKYKVQMMGRWGLE